jgi:hypothetical protein
MNKIEFLESVVESFVGDLFVGPKNPKDPKQVERRKKFAQSAKNFKDPGNEEPPTVDTLTNRLFKDEVKALHRPLVRSQKKMESIVDKFVEAVYKKEYESPPARILASWSPLHAKTKKTKPETKAFDKVEKLWQSGKYYDSDRETYYMHTEPKDYSLKTKNNS